MNIHHSILWNQSFIVSRRSCGRRRPGRWAICRLLGGRRGQWGLALSLGHEVAPHCPVLFHGCRLRTDWKRKGHDAVGRRSQSLLFFIRRRLLIGAWPVPPDDRLWGWSHRHDVDRIRWSDWEGYIHDAICWRTQVVRWPLIRAVPVFLRFHRLRHWLRRWASAADHIGVHAATWTRLCLSWNSAPSSWDIRRSAKRLHAWRRAHGLIWKVRRLGRIHVDIVGLRSSRPWS